MRTLILITVLLLKINLVSAQNIRAGAGNCWIEQIVVISKGDTLNNYPPVIGTLLENGEVKYNLKDTTPGKSVIEVLYCRRELTDNGKKFGIVTDLGIFFYYISLDSSNVILKSDSLKLPGIVNATTSLSGNNNKLFLPLQHLILKNLNI